MFLSARGGAYREEGWGGDKGWQSSQGGDWMGACLWTDPPWATAGKSIPSTLYIIGNWDKYSYDFGTKKLACTWIFING